MIVTKLLVDVIGAVKYVAGSERVAYDAFCGTSVVLDKGYELFPISHAIPEVLVENKAAFAGFGTCLYFNPVIASLRGVGNLRIGSLHVVTKEFTTSGGKGLYVFASSDHRAKRGGTYSHAVAMLCFVGPEELGRTVALRSLATGCFTTGHTHDKIYLDIEKRITGGT